MRDDEREVRFAATPKLPHRVVQGVRERPERGEGDSDEDDADQHVRRRVAGSDERPQRRDREAERDREAPHFDGGERRVRAQFRHDPVVAGRSVVRRVRVAVHTPASALGP